MRSDHTWQLASHVEIVLKPDCDVTAFHQPRLVPELGLRAGCLFQQRQPVSSGAQAPSTQWGAFREPVGDFSDPRPEHEAISRRPLSPHSVP